MGGTASNALTLRDLEDSRTIDELKREGPAIAEVLVKEMVISRECGKLGSTARVGIPEQTLRLLRAVGETQYCSIKDGRRFLSESIESALRDMGYKNPRVKCGWFSIRARGL